MTEQEIRAMRVAEAVHSARMEGGGVTSSFFADARDYIEEQIDAHELVNSYTSPIRSGIRMIELPETFEPISDFRHKCTAQSYRCHNRYRT